MSPGYNLTSSAVARDFLDECDDAQRRSFLSSMIINALASAEAIAGRQKVGHVGGRRCWQRRAIPRRPARPRRRTTPAPAGSARCAAAGWRRSGWCPFRISAPAGMSGRAHRRASPGSILSIIRRIRTRAPTCLSVGFWRPAAVRHPTPAPNSPRWVCVADFAPSLVEENPARRIAGAADLEPHVGPCTALTPYLPGAGARLMFCPCAGP